MQSDSSRAALECTLAAMQQACPEIKTAFIFDVDKRVLAGSLAGSKEAEGAAQKSVEAFNALAARAQNSGGLTAVTLFGANCQAKITQVDQFYLATVAQNGVDEKTLNALTEVMVPTVLRVLEIVNLPSTPAALDPKNYGADCSRPEESAPELDLHSIPSSAAVSQLMVENLGGLGKLLGASDSVRVESSIIANWSELYPSKRIEEVEVEAINTGKKVRCRLKPLSDAKLQGVIQMPEKVQVTLETQKGALVMVKPVLT